MSNEWLYMTVLKLRNSKAIFAKQVKTYINTSLFLRLQETREELDEFQEGSRELEAELEAQLEQAEARQRELLSIKTRLETDNENLKVQLHEACKLKLVLII